MAVWEALDERLLGEVGVVVGVGSGEAEDWRGPSQDGVGMQGPQNPRLLRIETLPLNITPQPPLIFNSKDSGLEIDIFAWIMPTYKFLFMHMVDHRHLTQPLTATCEVDVSGAKALFRRQHLTATLRNSPFPTVSEDTTNWNSNRQTFVSFLSWNGALALHVCC